MSGAGVIETVKQLIKGFGEQIAENPLFSTVSEDFINDILSPVNAYDFGDFKLILKVGSEEKTQRKKNKPEGALKLLPACNTNRDYLRIKSICL